MISHRADRENQIFHFLLFFYLFDFYSSTKLYLDGYLLSCSIWTRRIKIHKNYGKLCKRKTDNIEITNRRILIKRLHYCFVIFKILIISD